MVKVTPPKAGVVTETCTMPGAASAEPGTVATTWPAETKLVVRAVVFQFTIELAEKLEPFTVSMRACAALLDVVLLGIS